MAKTKPPPPGPPPGMAHHSPRELPVYKSVRDLSAHLRKFQQDHGLTDTEMLMVLMDLETRFIRHLVLGDPHPAEL